VSALILELGIGRVNIAVGTEWSSENQGASQLVCRVNSEFLPCGITRPSSEHVTGTTVDIRVTGSQQSIWVPYLSAGAAWQWSEAPDNRGEKRAWVSPQAALGFELGSRVIAATLEARYRLLNRWGDQGTSPQLALVAGVRWRFFGAHQRQMLGGRARGTRADGPVA
jgi:hypothetical protein